jgi:hypothetical protein
MSLTDFSEPQPSLAWTFDGTALDVISGTIGPTSGNVNGVTTTTGLYYDTTTPKYGTGAIKFTNDNPPATGNCLIYDNIFNIPTGSSSFSFWFKALANPASGGGSVFGIRGGTCLLYTVLSPGPLRIAQVLVINNINYTSSWSLAETNISLNQWIHYSYTFTSTRATVYINGVATSTCTYPQINTDSSNVWKGFTLGTYNYGPNFGMSCELDDLRIYNTALTAAQVQSIYTQSGAPASNFRVMPQPSLAWDFNGTTTPYIGTATGTTTGTVSYNSSGKYGQSVIIRNDNDASFANSLSYSFTTPVSTATGFTISCWIKFLKLPVGSGVGFNGRMALFAGYPFYFYILNGTFGIYGFYSSYILPGGGNCQNYQTDLTTPSTGVWYHVTYTFGQGTSSVYFNGTLKRTAPYVGDSTMGGITIANNGIPSDQSGSFELDDLRIFDRALTSSQVQSIYNQQGVPGRAVQTNSPIQPGYIYAPLYNSSIIGTSSPWVVNSQNPDPTTSGITGADNWNTDPNRTNLWSLAPFKYFIFLSRNAYPLNNIPVEGLRYPVLISVTGTYQLSLLVCTGGGNSDSLFWNFDNDAPVNQGGFSVPESFSTWYSFGNVTLTAGSHTLSLQMREPVGIGAIKLTSTIYPGTYYNVTPITMSGAPLFNQISQSAASSAVGAFSLRAVNGTSARAVNVAPGGTFPPSAMTQTATNSSTQTLGTGGKFQGSYIASSSRSDYGWGASGAFARSVIGFPNNLWQVGNYPVGGGTVLTPTTTTTGATNYNGEWLQFQTPFPINLTGYSVATSFLTSVVLLASTTGASSSWVLVDSKSSITPGSIITNTGLNFAGYSYFRFVLITSTINYPALFNAQFFGTVPSLAQDFYADERGNLLTAPVVGTSLQNWLGGATGYVTKWYDQSGKGNDAIQNTAANQPIIQRATKGPGYSCFFNGTTNYLTGMSYNILNSTNFSFNVVERRTGSSSGGTATNDLTLLSCGDIGATGKLLYLTYRNNTNSLFGSWSPELFTTITAYNSPSEPIRYTCATASSTSGRRVYIYNDPLGNPIASSDAAQTSLMSMTSGNFQIGYYVFGSSTSYYKGEIYELLVFTQSLYDIDGTTSINKIYQNQLSYTGT